MMSKIMNLFMVKIILCQVNIINFKATKTRYVKKNIMENSHKGNQMFICCYINVNLMLYNHYICHVVLKKVITISLLKTNIYNKTTIQSG